MVRPIILGLAVVIVLFGTFTKASNEVALRESRATFPLTAFQNEMAVKFFKLVSEDTTSNNDPEMNYGVYNYGQCVADSRQIYSHFASLDEWALQFPDSWGRLPIGLFWGHQISMGAFTECMEIRHYTSDTEESLIRGQYCLARVPIKKMFAEVHPWTLHDVPLEKAQVSYKLQNATSFDLGMCLPKSCSPKQSDNYIKELFNNEFGVVYTDDSPPIVRGGKYCDYEKPIELRPIDIFAIFLFSFITFLMIVSSIYDLQMQKKGQKGKDLFLAFSAVTNARKLFRVSDNSKNPNVIECMSGIRTFSMMWVIFGHGMMTMYDLPHINKNKFYTWTQTPYSILVQNATLCVDSFFFMSGLLMLWGAFREMEKTKGRLNIGMMYFHRYIRLTPVVAVVVLYIMSLYHWSGAGPMWMRVGNQDEKCETSWWANFLYVQNYAFPKHICMSQSWYLAVDTQLYVISPLFLIPLWKWGKKAMIPTVIFLILCLACTFATFLANDFTIFRVLDDDVEARQTKTYYPTHTRIPSWLLGVVFGYYFFKNNRGKRIPLAKHWIITGWFVAFATMLACLWGPYWRLLDNTPDSPILEGAFYEPLSRSAWSIATGWIIWACYNGHGGLINDFLSWGFFQVFARLSYCMYCIHRIVQWVLAGRLQTDTYFSDYDYVLHWWAEFGITLLVSIYVTLGFESPVLGIEKALLGKPAPKPAPVAEKIEPTTENLASVEVKPSTSAAN